MAAATIVLALGAGLAGCAPSAPKADPTAAPSAPTAPSVTPTPTPAPPSAPTVRFDVPCDSLLPTATLGSLFSDELTVQTPSQIAASTQSGISFVTLVHSVGGEYCNWSNGKQVVNDQGYAADGQLATIEIYPDAAYRWKAEASYYGLKTTTQQYCSADPTSCYLNALVDGFVVHATLNHLKIKAPKPGQSGLSAVPAGVKKVFDSIRSQLSSAGDLAPAWTPPADTKPAPATCAGYLDPAKAGKAIGTKAKVGFHGLDGGIPFAADVPIFGCGFGPNSVEAVYGGINWLAAGAWAQADALATGTTVATTPLAIDGLADGDQAFIGEDTDKSVVVDLVLGGNWVELRFYALDAALPKPTVSRTAYAKAIAAQVVVRVNS